MRLTLKHASNSYELELPEDATLGELTDAAEKATNVFKREQKILCKGRTIVDPATSIVSSTPLASLGCVNGSKLLLWAAGGSVKRPSRQQVPQRPNAASGLPSSAHPNASVASTRTISERRAKNWQATRMATLEPPVTSAIQRWPDSLLQVASELRVLNCSRVLLTREPVNEPSSTQGPVFNAPSFPLGVFGCLQHLSLVDCGLPDTAIDWAGLSTLQNLTCLRLQGNRLKTFGGHLAPGSLPELRELDLSINCLEGLCGSLFAGWNKLEKLDVSQNQLRELPLELGTCVSLVELRAAGNQIKGIALEMARLTNLMELHLADNRLTAEGIPTEIFLGCKALQTLDLHANPLTMEELRQLPGWDAFDNRRKRKHDKMMQARVMGTEWNEGADTKAVRHWK